MHPFLLSQGNACSLALALPQMRCAVTPWIQAASFSSLEFAERNANWGWGGNQWKLECQAARSASACPLLPQAWEAIPLPHQVSVTTPEGQVHRF